MNHPIVLGVSGASGALYAARLLDVLVAANKRVHFVMSPAAIAVAKQELQVHIDPLRNGPKTLVESLSDWCQPHSRDLAVIDKLVTAHAHQDLLAPIASGSYFTEAMVVCPCSGGTLSGIVHAASGNLIERAADVHLKERRKLVLVPRETPLSTPQLENMLKASQYGAIVLPASPGFYHGAKAMMELVDFVVARICDQLGAPHLLMRRWGTDEFGAPRQDTGY